MRTFLCCAFLAASMALPPATASAEVDGKKAFKKQCSNCHEIDKVGLGLKGLTAEERTQHLDRFLSAHHATAADGRAAIIAYINLRLDR